MRELKEEIEGMTKYHQTHVLRILRNCSAKDFLSENQNGTFVNMTSLQQTCINELRRYSKYVKEQQQTLRAGEREKQRIENEFFKDLKDTHTEHENNAESS
jgi:hypothetical protein